jgi:hypothetical protein
MARRRMRGGGVGQVAGVIFGIGFFIAIILLSVYATGGFSKKTSDTTPSGKPVIPEDQKHYSQDTM